MGASQLKWATFARHRRHEPLLDSSDMGPPEWKAIVRMLSRHYYDFDGFVVIMGTDTMAYAAAAASFMMENLGKPIVFTGSMVPLCELYNDAKRNLVVACIVAGYVDVPEVTLFINSTLFRGNRVTKVSCRRWASRRPLPRRRRLCLVQSRHDPFAPAPPVVRRRLRRWTPTASTRSTALTTPHW